MTSKPIVDMLTRYAQEGYLRFHMPGHKGRGLCLPLDWDITEIPASDDLYHPTGPIQRSQQLLAEACGAHASFLLVGGATAGIHAMLLATVPPHGKVILPRDVHRSVINACALYDLVPIWMDGYFHGQEGLYDSPEKQILYALETERASAVLVTRPDYYGRCMDLSLISKACAKANVKLLVDAAHGAHFHFSESLPRGPEQEANLWVESAHKTLPALTQAAWLHAGNEEDAAAAARMLPMVQTSSPSFLLMASLDEARAMMQDAEHSMDVLVRRCMDLGEHLRDAGFMVANDAWAQSFDYACQDPTRLVIDVRQTGMSGLEAARLLQEAGIVVEMADFYRVVCIATLHDRACVFEELERTILDLKVRESMCVLPSYAPPWGDSVMSLSDAVRGKVKRLPLMEALGYISASPMGAYPPGIACCLPGQRITQDVLRYLDEIRDMGGSLFGVSDGQVDVCRDG